MSALIEFDQVCKYYQMGDTLVKAADHITMKIEKGEFVAIVGQSGSGKSTIINMIIGFLKATKGCVSIDGKPIEELNLNEYRHNISVVPQNSILFMGTIRDNITYGLDNVNEKKLNEVIKAANIDEFTSKLPNGLNTQVGEHGGKLSGGQKQRISIARAMLKNSKIVILDEATASIDPENEAMIQKAISALTKGKTLIVIAHRLGTITDADNIVVVQDGHIEAQGTHEQLKENCPLYSKMWNSYLGVRDVA